MISNHCLHFIVDSHNCLLVLNSSIKKGNKETVYQWLVTIIEKHLSDQNLCQINVNIMAGLLCLPLVRRKVLPLSRKSNPHKLLIYTSLCEISCSSSSSTSWTDISSWLAIFHFKDLPCDHFSRLFKTWICVYQAGCDSNN